jgi:hypothetical protein
MRKSKTISTPRNQVAGDPKNNTARLPRLVEVYRCTAIIRNPLAIVGSWHSVRIPAAFGRSPVAEALCPALTKSLEQSREDDDRMFRLLDWFFRSYAIYLPSESVIKYETIVASGGSALAAITPEASRLNAELVDMNVSTYYDRKHVVRMGRALLRIDGAWLRFYSRPVIQHLIHLYAQAVRSDG